MPLATQDATNLWDKVPLIVAARADPDLAEYPETGKIAAIVGGEHRFHRSEDAVSHAGLEPDR